MKPETAALLEKHMKAGKFQFISTDLGLELEYSITDQEKEELAKAEYGQSLAGPVDELFIKIMKKTIQLAVEKAKQEFSDKLSDL